MVSTIQGASAPPIEDPLSKRATAHPDSRRGNHSETALVAPGQLPASPRPSANRNPAKLRSPEASDVAIAATEYHSTARLRPARVPRRSIARPAIVWPIVYAARNAMSTIAKSVFVQLYSVLRYGARTLSVCRSM